LCAARIRATPFGAQPNALAFDNSGKTLFVCNGTQNAVAVFQFKPGESKLIGLIPSVGFRVRLHLMHGTKTFAAPTLKASATKWEKLKKDWATALDTIQDNMTARFRLCRFHRKLNWKNSRKRRSPICAIHFWHRQNCRREKMRLRNQFPNASASRAFFRTSIYIIKENRSYDQVLGDIQEGNGDADLCVFGERVTPNQHKLVHEFALLDNTYCCGILSADGHQWTDTRWRRITSSVNLPAGRAVIRLAALASAARTHWRIRLRVSFGTMRWHTEKRSRISVNHDGQKALENFRKRNEHHFSRRLPRLLSTARMGSFIPASRTSSVAAIHHDEHDWLGCGCAGYFVARRSSSRR